MPPRGMWPNPSWVVDGAPMVGAPAWRRRRTVITWPSRSDRNPKGRLAGIATADVIETVDRLMWYVLRWRTRDEARVLALNR